MNEQLEQLDFEGEDPNEVITNAIRLYSKEMSAGNLEDYRKLKAQLTAKSSEENCVPWEYMERATAALKSVRAERDGKLRRVRGILLVAVGLTLVALSGLAYVLLDHRPIAFLPTASPSAHVSFLIDHVSRQLTA